MDSVCGCCEAAMEKHGASISHKFRALQVMRKSSIFFFLLGVIPAISSESDQLPKEIGAFFAKHCTDCHDQEMKKGELNVAALDWHPTDRRNFDTWVKIFDRVRRGEMPPEKKPRPEAAPLAEFLRSLEDPLHKFSAAEQAKSGRTLLRRLNRNEYERTVQDLLKIDIPLRQILPEDTPLHGFDTVAEGLRFSQLQMEQYLEAADTALEAALALTPQPVKLLQRVPFKEHKEVRKHLDIPEGTVTDKNNPNSKHRVLFRELADGVAFFSTPDYIIGLKEVQIPAAGKYRIKVSGYAYQTNGRPVTLMLHSSNYKEKRLLGYFDLPADKPRIIETLVSLRENEHLITSADEIGFDADGKGIWNVGAKEFSGTGVVLQWIEVEGPLVDMWPPASVTAAAEGVPVIPLEKTKRPWRHGKQVAYQLSPPEPKAALGEAVERFAARAIRRPLDAGESNGFVALGQETLHSGGSFDDALRVSLRAVLCSPQFLLFEERPGALDGPALAARLSYFLWSSQPDAELRQLAESGKLTDKIVLRAQVERLLKSPQAHAFSENFVGQWLDLRNIAATMPDAKLYPEFDPLLQSAMVQETEAFFTEILTKNLSVANFIQSDFAVLNRRMAEHYEIPEVTGETFRAVKIPPGNPRGGVLTHASVLKVTANGTVTSPVLRGAWVMKRLLGQPPPPPPPNVGSIEPDTRGATTIREQLAKHRTTETCASCHRTMDPPGFALENFDVIGGWRTNYRSQDKGASVKRKMRGQNVWQYKEGPTVDASGELADGRKFSGITDFKQLLLEQQDAVLRCLAEKLIVYSTGAGLQFADRAAIDAIVAQVKSEGRGLRSLVHAVVESPLFLNK